MSRGCRGQAGSAGRGAGEGITSLRGPQNLVRESMLCLYRKFIHSFIFLKLFHE